METDNKPVNSNVLFQPKISMDIDNDNDHQDNEQFINNQFQRPYDCMNNSRSILTKSSMMTFGKMICCLCSVTIDATPTGMCSACANSQINITDGITTESLVLFCKQCQRYQRPPWVRLKPESNEMMSFLLNKVKGLKGLKLTDTNFIWTEPHSKRIKIKITVQKEIDKLIKQSSMIIEFVEEWTQCDDCKKTFTPHLWNAACQVRQKVNHKRTFMYLEQAVLKHKMHDKALNVKETPEGIDFYFKNKSHANTFSDFIHSVLPAKIKPSKQLVSHDQWSNIYNYKYTFMIEIAPVCKDDIIILSQQEYKELGGIGPVLLCYKTSTNIHLMDPLTMEVIEFDENTYWRFNFRSFIDRSTLEEFLIQNVEEENQYDKINISITASYISSNANMSKSTHHKNVKPNEKPYHSKRDNHDFKIVKVDCTKPNNDKLYSFRCHLGGNIRPGDVFYGYDISSINTTVLDCDTSNFPEIVLVKKKYQRDVKKRIWKLNRMNIDEEAAEKEDKTKFKKNKNKEKTKEDQFNEFLEDVEENPDMRKNINLYKDDNAIKDLEKQFGKMGIDEITKTQKDEFGIDIANLMDELTINEENVEEVNTKLNQEDKEVFAEPNPVNVNLKKKIKKNPDVKPEATKEDLKQMKGKKRDRKGSNVESSDDHN